MGEWLARIFSSEGFMPHGHCYLWNGPLITLHVVSDGLIGLAYTTIPISLIYVARKRRDIPFHWMFVFFGAFIVACGATHYLEILTLWTPLYWLSGAVKAITAIASVPTAVVLARWTPKIVALPSPAQLRKAEEKFRGLLDAAPDAIVIVDASGAIALVNAQAERVFGYGRQELLAQPVEMLVPRRVRERHADHRAVYFDAPKTRAMGSGLELRGVRKNGDEFPVEISLSPLHTQDGMLVTSAIRDITDSKETEHALKRANADLEAFSRSVAHDLRAPLRGMSGFAQLLLDKYGSQLDAEGQDWLAEIQLNARRMGDLIDALLSLSRVSRADVRKERVDLTSLAREVATRLGAAEPDRKVRVDVEEGLSAVMDRALARSLVENLVGNAWKFSARKEEARVEVGATKHEGAHAFFVRDNGAGFDMQYADRLFAPFQRLHAATDFPGTGVGLATVQRIVHRHGGRIWAEATIGGGATFLFTLPGGVA